MKNNDGSDTKLWSDKKRIFGLPISFTNYFLENNRLYLKKGLLKTETNEVLLYRILDIKSSQNFSQKIFGVGTVSIYSADQSNRILNLINIKNPNKVHRYLSDLVEKERQEKGIAGREIIGTGGVSMNYINEHEDVCDGDCVSFNDFE
jgi:hypothetical protein